MRIVLDENLPRQLTRIFGSGHQVATVKDLGLAGTANGALLAQLEGNHDAFITADKNLRYQQNLAGRSLAIVELPTNRRPLGLHDGRNRVGGDDSDARFLYPGRTTCAALSRWPRRRTRSGSAPGPPGGFCYHEPPAGGPVR
jgi:PIN like domain